HDALPIFLESEQFYLDSIFSLDESNTYNLLKVAGSSLGRTFSAETKALLSEAHKGKTYSTKTKAKISTTLGSAIFVYDLEGSLVNTFPSARRAAPRRGDSLRASALGS